MNARTPSLTVTALGFALALTAPVAAQEAGPQYTIMDAREDGALVARGAPEKATPEATAQIAPQIVPMPPEAPLDLSGAEATTPAMSAQQAAVQKALEARVAEAPRSGPVRRMREAINAFYAERQYAPLWTDAAGWNDKARSAIARLERAADDGLDLAQAPSPDMRAADADSIGRADVLLSESIALYARQASGGRIDPRTIAATITAKPDVVDPARALHDAAAASDVGSVLQGYNPQHRGYLLLREKLAELRQAAPAVARKAIPKGPVLKLGMRDTRVPLIRARFGLDHARAGDNDELIYDTRLAEAVAGFQKANGMQASGVLTARTVAALSGGEPSRLEGEIISNMERWRWMPRDMGDERIEVNIPDYTVRVYKGDTVIHQARVIVGKPQTATPIFSNVMQFLIVNPYWNVPPSIVKNEMLPKLKEDPDYLRRMGYEVITRKGQMFVRQPPGERNALGFIKFMFPNEHSVYLHDTPSRNLFGNAKRAYSHGCVRVDQPFALAEIVLGQGWTQERVKKLKGGGERTVRMPKPLPIHIGYFSAYVDEHGKLQLREDIYGYSQKVKAALGV